MGATAKTYVLASADEGKYISFEVTPVAATGTAQGTAVESDTVGTVAPAPVTVVFNSLVAADGTATASTTALTLLFDQDVAGLAIGDITVSGATKGTLTKESGTGVYTLTISNITVADGEAVNVAVAKTDFTFTPANKDVAVRKHTPIVFRTITASAGANGAISPSGAVPLADGGGQGFTFIPGNGYEIDTVTVDGVALTSPGASYTFANVTADHTISVTFRRAVTPPSAPDSDPDPIQYQIIQGQNSLWYAPGGGSLTFKANGPFGLFESVWVDGFYVAPKYYIAVSGSTVVTLKAAYLQTLAPGEHTLRVNYADGFAKTAFTVQRGLLVPKTGDMVSLLPVLMLAGAALVLRGKH